MTFQLFYGRLKIYVAFNVDVVKYRQGCLFFDRCVMVGRVLRSVGYVCMLGSWYSIASENVGVPHGSEVHSTIDFKKVLSSTVLASEMHEMGHLYSIDADNAYGGSDLPIDWEAIYESALAGNPVAQFCHGDRCLQLATKLYNSKRFNKKFEAYMFLLISAIKGNFNESKEKFIYLGDISDLKENASLSEIVNKAIVFAEKL
jgi:hypothetical protein